MTEKMTRERVVEIVAAARAKGERPDLSGLNLSSLDLSGLDLNGANLGNANLSGVDLTGAILIDVNLRGAYLYGAILTAVALRGANLHGANLPGLFLDGLPSGDLAFLPTPGGWCLTIGCWRGTTDELREMIADDTGWPEAMGREVARRRPMLEAAADMCDSYAAVNNWALAEVKDTANRWKENR